MIDIGSYLVFVLAIIIFIIIFGLARSCDKAQLQEVDSVSSNNLDLGLVLLSYLRTPVETGSRKMQMSELIALSVFDDALKKDVRDETEKIFFPIYEKCFTIRINTGQSANAGYPDFHTEALIAAPGSPVTVELWLDPHYYIAKDDCEYTNQEDRLEYY